MNKLAKEVTKDDLIPLDQYSKERKELRKNLIDFKKNRRVHLGPYATFYFECYETMLAQIQEMLFIEKGGDEQIKDELDAYNPLIPKGDELVATLMFEIDNPVSRNIFLNKIGEIDKKVYLKVGSEKIAAKAEKDLERTSDDGKASSVQFIHFFFTKKQKEEFKNSALDVFIGINHKEYTYSTKISNLTRLALQKDFS